MNSNKGGLNDENIRRNSCYLSMFVFYGNIICRSAGSGNFQIIYENLAAPGGLALSNILAGLAALISRGRKGIITKKILYFYNLLTERNLKCPLSPSQEYIIVE